MNHRLATLDDIPLLAGLNHQLTEDEQHRNRFHDQAWFEARMRSFLTEDYQAVLFERDGQTVAYALFRPDGPETIYLRQLFVARGCRSQGIGRTVLAILRQNYWPADKRITVGVLADNARAIAFYRAVGFRHYASEFELPASQGIQEHVQAPPCVTAAQLVADLRRLGVAAGQTLMLHASVKAVGWIIGGPDVILRALLEVLGPTGTLAMYVGWADGTYELASWPAERQRLYQEQCPPFDPATSRAQTAWSILAEYLRTSPGACRSGNPEASVAAVGAQAAWLTADHPLSYGYGPGSPLAKLIAAKGKVLLLGAPLNTVTLLHHAEYVAAVPDKRIVRYRQPILQHGQARWVEIEEFDTSRGIRDWPHGDGDYFTALMKAYLAQGTTPSGRVGAAVSYLVDAAELNTFAVPWLERELATALGRGAPSPRTSASSELQRSPNGHP